METPEGKGDDLLRELEESIPQGVPNATHYGRRASDLDTDLASLDSLLCESMEKKQLDDQYKADRDRKGKGYAGMSKEEIDFCNSRMHAFEMAREWDADYALAVFQQFTCDKCQTTRVVFSRLMEHHQHRRVKTTQRWMTVNTTKLPMSTVVEDRPVPMCVDCMEDYGLASTADSPWLEDVLDPPGVNDEEPEEPAEDEQAAIENEIFHQDREGEQQ